MRGRIARRRGRAGRLVGVAVFGAVAVYVLTSVQARARLRVLLEQAWQWSVHAARRASGVWEGAQPADETQVEEPEPAPTERDLVWAELGEAPLAPSSSWTEKLAEAEAERAPSEAPARIDYPVLAPAAEDEPDESGPRRRWWARIAAVAGAACAAGAIGAVSWAIWGSDSGGASRVASGEANVLAAVSRPGAKRLPVAGSLGKVILVVAPDGRAALIVQGIRSAGRGKQFEAWVIVKNPKRAGLFSGGPGTVVVPLSARVPKGATVAVTLEAAGGVAAPTSKPLFATTRPSS